MPVVNTRKLVTRPWKADESARLVPNVVLLTSAPAESRTSYDQPLTHGSVPSVTLKTTSDFGAVTSTRYRSESYWSTSNVSPGAGAVPQPLASRIVLAVLT